MFNLLIVLGIFFYTLTIDKMGDAFLNILKAIAGIAMIFCASALGACVLAEFPVLIIAAPTALFIYEYKRKRKIVRN